MVAVSVTVRRISPPATTIAGAMARRISTKTSQVQGRRRRTTTERRCATGGSTCSSDGSVRHATSSARNWLRSYVDLGVLRSEHELEERVPGFVPAALRRAHLELQDAVRQVAGVLERDVAEAGV